MATRATQKEYSSELGPKNDSKMEPQMEPTRQRPTLTKYAQALSDCTSAPPTPWGAQLSLFFRARKKSTNIINKCLFKFWRQTGPKSAPPGSRIHARESFFFVFCSGGGLGAPVEHRVPKSHSRSSRMSPKMDEIQRQNTSKS